MAKIKKYVRCLGIWRQRRWRRRRSQGWSIWQVVVPFHWTGNTGRAAGWGCSGSEMKFSVLNMLHLRCLRNISVNLSSRELDVLPWSSGDGSGIEMEIWKSPQTMTEVSGVVLSPSTSEHAEWTEKRLYFKTLRNAKYRTVTYKEV